MVFKARTTIKPFFQRKLQYVLNKHFKIKPKDIALYRRALVHKSFANNRRKQGENNERLEFLGDALLNAFTAEYLFEKLPTASEGKLTKMRAKIVSRRYLHKLAFKVEVNHLVAFSANSKLTENSLAGNAFEALLGAIYLDTGHAGLWKAMHRIFNENIDLSKVEQEERDYKSLMYEWCQKNKVDPIYELLEEQLDGGKTHFVVSLTIENEKYQGAGRSKKIAEREAAQLFSEQKNLK